MKEWRIWCCSCVTSLPLSPGMDVLFPCLFCWSTSLVISRESSRKANSLRFCLSETIFSLHSLDQIAFSGLKMSFSKHADFLVLLKRNVVPIWEFFWGVGVGDLLLFLSKSFRIVSYPWCFKNSLCVCMCVRACTLVWENMRERQRDRSTADRDRNSERWRKEGRVNWFILLGLAKLYFPSALDSHLIILCSCSVQLLCFLCLPGISVIWYLDLPKWWLMSSFSFI